MLHLSSQCWHQLTALTEAVGSIHLTGNSYLVDPASSNRRIYNVIFSLAAVQVEVYRGFEKLRRTFREALKSGAVSFQTSSVCLSNPVQEAGSPESGLSYCEQGNRAHVLAMQLSPVEFQENRHSHSHVGAVANSSVLDSSALEEFKVRWLSFSFPVMLLLWSFSPASRRQPGPWFRPRLQQLVFTLFLLV